MRVVLDANVLVSALISDRGSPGKILKKWEQERFDVVLSPPILQELERVIHYPRIQEQYSLPEEAIQKFLGWLGDLVIIVNPTVELSVIQEDLSDNRYLECAKAGGASFIVSGDKHLLELEEFEGIVILPPSGFLALLELEEGGKG